jgi:hypothetical protein
MSQPGPSAHLLPPLPLPNQAASQALHFRFASYDDASVLVEPYEYLLQVPGKELRSLLIDAFNKYAVSPSASSLH